MWSENFYNLLANFTNKPAKTIHNPISSLKKKAAANCVQQVLLLTNKKRKQFRARF